MMDFIMQHKEGLSIIAAAIIGSFLPKVKIYVLGQKVGSKLDKKTAKKIVEALNVFEEGMLNSKVDGNDKITSNIQIKKGTEELKMKLGLEGFPIKE